MDYIVAAANLRAAMFGLPGTRDRDEIAELLAKVRVPEFVPRSGVRIAVTDAEAQADTGSTDVDRLSILQQELLGAASLASLPLTPLEFEGRRQQLPHGLHSGGVQPEGGQLRH